MYCTLREYISINETFRLYDFGVAGHTVTEMGGGASIFEYEHFENKSHTIIILVSLIYNRVPRIR